MLVQPVEAGEVGSGMVAEKDFEEKFSQFEEVAWENLFLSGARREMIATDPQRSIRIVHRCYV